MNYKCLDKMTFVHNSFALATLEYDDLFPIMKWRNEQMNILRQNKELTEEDQKRYWKEVIQPSFNDPMPDILLFKFLQKNQMIGYGGLVYVNWIHKRAEVSFLMDTNFISDHNYYKDAFSIFLTLIKKVALECLRFNRLYTETYDCRPLHVKVLEESGFRLEGRMRKHNFINGRFVDSLIHGCIIDDSFKK